MKDKTFTICLILIICVLAAFQIVIDWSHKEITRENEFYNIFQTCVLSVTAQNRTDNHIENCWIQAELLTGLEIKRFDK